MSHASDQPPFFLIKEVEKKVKHQVLLTLASFVFLIFVGSSQILAQEDDVLENSQANLKNWITAQLPKVDQPELNELMGSDDETRAISAAWETVRRRIAIDNEAHCEQMAWFFGFAAAKSDFHPPPLWLKRVNKCKLDLENGGLLLPKTWKVRSAYAPYDFQRIISNDLQVLESNDKGIVLELHGGNKLRLNQENVYALNSSGRISGFAATKFSAIAFHREPPGAYYLNLINNSTGEKVWKTKVWSGAPLMIRGGIDTDSFVYDIQVRIDETYVYVYSASEFGITLGKFDRDDGSAILRFHSSLWDWDKR